MFHLRSPNHTLPFYRSSYTPPRRRNCHPVILPPQPRNGCMPRHQDHIANPLELLLTTFPDGHRRHIYHYPTFYNRLILLDIPISSHLMIHRPSR